jgi:hypothetical protein
MASADFGRSRCASLQRFGAYSYRSRTDWASWEDSDDHWSPCAVLERRTLLWDKQTKWKLSNTTYICS